MTNNQKKSPSSGKPSSRAPRAIRLDEVPTEMMSLVRHLTPEPPFP